MHAQRPEATCQLTLLILLILEIYLRCVIFFSAPVMARLHFDYGAARNTPIKEKARRGVVSLEEHNGLWNEVIIAQNHTEKVSTKSASAENMKLWASFFFSPKENRTLNCSETQYTLWLESSRSILHEKQVLRLITDLISSELSLKCFTRLHLFSQDRKVNSVMKSTCSVHPHSVNDIWSVRTCWSYATEIWSFFRCFSVFKFPLTH